MATINATAQRLEEISDLIFGTLPERGLETMTEDGIEFVICPSALTAQM